jgi:hypothetical protein
MAKRERSRTARRIAERDAARQVRERERLVVLEPGGAPGRAIELPTPAVVEPRAQATPCHQCGGALEVLEHVVVPDPHRSIRLVRARCRRCHAPRALYYRLPAAPS